MPRTPRAGDPGPLLLLSMLNCRQLDPEYDDIPEDLPEDEDEDNDHPSLTPAERNPNLK